METAIRSDREAKPIDSSPLPVLGSGGGTVVLFRCHLSYSLAAGTRPIVLARIEVISSALREPGAPTCDALSLVKANESRRRSNSAARKWLTILDMVTKKL